MLIGLEDRAIEWVCKVPPEKRRRWAIRLVLLTFPAEALTHTGMELLPEWFFRHMVMLISYLAIYMTGLDYVATTDVKVDTAEDETS